MEKASVEMDLDEWELLPDNNHSFLDFGLEHGKDLLFSKETSFGPKCVVDINYFICPSEPSKILEVTEEKRKEDPVVEKNPDDGLALEFKDIGVVPRPPPPPVIVANHRDVVSKVFFKKLEEDGFVDMKVEPPKSNTKGVIMPSIEPGPILFDEEEEGEVEFYKDEKNSELEMEGKETEKEYVGSEIREKHCWEGSELKIWRWRLVGGVGALCSIGVAAATICMFVLGGHQRQRHQHQNQMLQFQIYADEKRIKQVVKQANRLKQVLSAARGVPTTRARISFGGYYDGL